MKNIQTYIAKHKERFLQELFELLKMPSISADLAYQPQLLQTAEAVAKSLLNAGCENIQLLETKGNPVVYADKIINPELPTVLVYGHYDVQPADPLELWDTPPFEPTLKKTKLHPDGAIFARGACDDKGQMFMHIKAIEILIATEQLPCNVKFMIEGEEEVGSPSLAPFIEEHTELFENDVILISDTGMISNQQPSITTGLRGLSYVEVELTGPNRDLHSGFYGGAVANPINILSQMISKLHDENNHITIPGFYDHAYVLSKEERREMNKAPFVQKDYNKALNIEEEWGEKTYSTLERSTVRPSLDVNGIWGGYIGEGAKTVLPSKAYAKISMRLVSGQDPDEMTHLFTDYFTSLAPKSVTVKITPHHGGKAYRTPLEAIGYQAAYKAYSETFANKPIPQPSGGSIPIVSLFNEVFKSHTILMGFGLNSDAIHAPNEHYGLFNFYKGIETIPYFYKHFTEIHTNHEK
ncbi:MAG: dipeptidase [Wenyingzhuangia sp.]|uniref:dipeptidase n=1 Tax=Wenyingzhuangia sp. TaxID=1964193 RepID=UPI00321A2A96